MPARKNNPSVTIRAQEHTSTSSRRTLILGFVILVCLLVAIATFEYESTRHTANSSRSLTDMERHARENRQDLTSQLEYGNMLLKTGDRDKAMQVFAYAAKIAPRDARPYEGLAAVAFEDRRTDYARVNLEEAARLAPSDVTVWQTLAKLYMAMHDKPHALRAYQQVTHLKPDDERAWRQLGVLETEANLLAQGHESLLHAAALAPNDAEAQIDLANSDLLLGNLANAHAAYSKALTLKPDDPTALTGDAEALLQLDPSSNGLAKAEQQVTRALSLQPNAYGHLVLGRVYLQRRDYKKAVAEFQQALTLDRNQYRAYNYLSQAYASLGERGLARQAGEQFRQAYARAHTLKNGAKGR